MNKNVLDDILAEVDRLKRTVSGQRVDPRYEMSLLRDQFNRFHTTVVQQVFSPAPVDESRIYDHAVQHAAMTLRFIDNMGRYSYVETGQVNKSITTA